MKKISKEQVIKIWKNYCNIIDEENNFQTIGTSDEYLFSLKISQKIELLIRTSLKTKNKETKEVEYDYLLSIVFNTNILYCSFELSKDEYEELTELFEKNQIKIRAKKSENIIKECEKELENLL